MEASNSVKNINKKRKIEEIQQKISPSESEALLKNGHNKNGLNVHIKHKLKANGHSNH
jgi:hypothetical protein